MKGIASEVGLYYDSPQEVGVGDYLQTPTGRTYFARTVRVQSRGEHIGRKHIRAIVIDRREIEPDGIVHPIHWYKRGR